MYGENPSAVVTSTASQFAPGQVEPLGDEIMNRTAKALECANAIMSRLWSYKDRVHGSNPSAGVEAGKGPLPEAMHFAGAWRAKMGSLEDALATIETLSSEIANRF